MQILIKSLLCIVVLIATSCNTNMGSLEGTETALKDIKISSFMSMDTASSSITAVLNIKLLENADSSLKSYSYLYQLENGEFVASNELFKLGSKLKISSNEK